MLQKNKLKKIKKYSDEEIGYIIADIMAVTYDVFSLYAKSDLAYEDYEMVVLETRKKRNKKKKKGED